MQSDLHRRALGRTRPEAVGEADAFERALNGGLTFAEAEAAQIQTARELRDPEVTAGLKQGAFMVAVQTLHGASKMPGFDTWSKRKPAAPPAKAPSKKRKPSLKLPRAGSRSLYSSLLFHALTLIRNGPVLMRQINTSSHGAKL